MPVVAEVYLMCTVVGALILLVSAVMGGMGHGHAAHGHIGHAGGHLGHAGGHSGGHSGGPSAAAAQGHSGAFRSGGVGGQGGHAAAGHSGHAAAAHSSHAAPGTAGHSAGPRGTSAAGHAAAGRAAAGGAAGSAAGQGGAHGGQGGAAESNAPAPSLQSSHHVAMVGSQPDIAVTILTLLNPATISSFVVWFGACGLFAWRLMPFLPVNFTLPIALLGGLLGTKVTLTLLGVLVSKMYSSGSFTQQSLIGYEAEVTVGFTAQQTGEITCATGGPRYTLSARCFDAKDAFKRGARVIIADICDDVAFVQALPDELKPWEPDAANGSTIAIAPAPESIEPTTDPQP